MRRTLLLVAAAVVAVTLAGCGSGGSRTASPTGWANKAELRWMRSYGLWSHRVDLARTRFGTRADTVTHFFGSEGMPELRRSAAALESACSASLASPPTSRLQPVLERARRGCRAYASVAHAVRTTDTAVVYGVMSNDLIDRLRQADRRFDSVSSGPLPGTGSLAVKSETTSALHSHIDPALGRVAARLAGRPVRVRCWYEADWSRLDAESAALSGHGPNPGDAGWTEVGGSDIDIQAETCGELESLRERPHASRVRSEVAADAVRILAHESQHAAGVSDEAIAECYGLQHVAEVAIDLGASSPDAAGLARTAWAAYPLEPSDYRSADCRDGGPLDLRPDDPHWP